MNGVDAPFDDQVTPARGMGKNLDGDGRSPIHGIVAENIQSLVQKNQYVGLHDGIQSKPNIKGGNEHHAVAAIFESTVNRASQAKNNRLMQ